MNPILSVRNLNVTFHLQENSVFAVQNLSFDLDAGSTLGIVGESGSGKSVTSLAIMGLLDQQIANISGEILFEDLDLTKLSQKNYRKIRSQKISMIFQDSLAALHPYYRVGNQIAEVYRAHNKVTKKAAVSRAIDMLDRVGIPEPQKRFRDYPHQFSGGMRQRVMIAMALVCNPKIIIADEPTTALDVTVQAQILELLKDIQKEFQAAIIFITHDLGVISEFSDKVLVMYSGQAFEIGPTHDLLINPSHPYTLGLLNSIPGAHKARQRFRSIPGVPPTMLKAASNCSFQDRCQFVEKFKEMNCKNKVPDLRSVGKNYSRLTRCFLPVEELSSLKVIQNK